VVIPYFNCLFFRGGCGSGGDWKYWWMGPLGVKGFEVGGKTSTVLFRNDARQSWGIRRSG
jgi:hypothetical protein